MEETTETQHLNWVAVENGVWKGGRGAKPTVPKKGLRVSNAKSTSGPGGDSEPGKEGAVRSSKAGTSHVNKMELIRPQEDGEPLRFRGVEPSESSPDGGR